MRTQRAPALLVTQLYLIGLLSLAGGAATAADRRPLAALCGLTLTADTVVEVQGGQGRSFGDCPIVLEGAWLRIDQAALDGERLAITGSGAASLDIVGARIRAALEVTGEFVRTQLSNSLVRGESAEIDAVSGDIVVRFSTFRTDDVRIATGSGSIRVRKAKVGGRSTFAASFGGIDIRSSEFKAQLDAVALGTGDLAFLSNKIRGSASFVGDERIAVAGNTFQTRRNGAGGVELEGDIVLLNNLSEGHVTLRPIELLIVIANTFEAGRPSIEGTPLSCIVEDNVPPLPCP